MASYSIVFGLEALRKVLPGSAPLQLTAGAMHWAKIDNGIKKAVSTVSDITFLIL